MIDLDLLTLPSNMSLGHAVETVGRSGADDVVCANGHEQVRSREERSDELGMRQLRS